MSDDLCPGCGDDLRSSVNMVTAAGEHLKSCPNCSAVAGRHAFYRYEQFGERTMNGRKYVQTWCTACRGKQSPPPPQMTC